MSVVQEPPKRSKSLEATLELGRNWALATALAAFAVAMSGMEAIHGIAMFKKPIAFGGVILATIWIFMSVERATQVMEINPKSRRGRFTLWLGATFLILIGACIVLGLVSMSENRQYVQICSDYADRPESGVYRDKKCQQLYKERAELKATLERLNPLPADH